MDPYFNSVYDKWRRGLRVWFQVSLLSPHQGYIIDYSTLPVSMCRWIRNFPNEAYAITALPHNVSLVSSYDANDEPPEYIQEFTDDELREMDLEALHYQLPNAANEYTLEGTESPPPSEAANEHMLEGTEIPTAK